MKVFFAMMVLRNKSKRLIAGFVTLLILNSTVNIASRRKLFVDGIGEIFVSVWIANIPDKTKGFYVGFISSSINYDAKME